MKIYRREWGKMKAGRSRLNANSREKVEERSEENQIKIKNYGSECL